MRACLEVWAERMSTTKLRPVGGRRQHSSQQLLILSAAPFVGLVRGWLERNNLPTGLCSRSRTHQPWFRDPAQDRVYT